MAAQGYIGRAPGESSVIVARQTFTPTGITTNFTFASGYTVGYVDAYLNGARLIEGDDYTATDGSVVGLTTHAISGDVLELVVYKAFNLANVTGASGDFSIADKIVHTNDVDTAIRFPQADTFTVETAGSEVLRVDANSNVGIGTTNTLAAADPKNQSILNVGVVTSNSITASAGTFGSLNVGGTLTYEDVTNSVSPGITTTGGLVVTGLGATFGSGVGIADSIYHIDDDNTAIRFPAADTFTVETAGTERVRVDSSGRFLVGIDASQSVGFAHRLQVEGTDSGSSSISLLRNSNDSSSAQLNLAKTRGTSTGSNTVVQDDDSLGEIKFRGADGTDKATEGARITASVDGTPGSDDMPGRLTFHTTADGASSPTERLRITASGLVGIGTDIPGANLHVHGAVGGAGQIYVTDGDAAGTGNSFLISKGGTTTTLKDRQASSNIDFGTADTHAVRIDSSQRVIIGSSNNNVNNDALQVNTSGGSNIGVSRFSNNAGGPDLFLIKSRNTTPGSHTAVADNDVLGQIRFRGDDGTNYVEGCRLFAEVNGSVSTNTVTTDLVFGSGTTGTERLRISSGGVLLVGATAAVGEGGTPADLNSTEVGRGYINLARDDTAAADHILFGKNGSVASSIGTDTTNTIVFKTGTTEAARFDSSQRLLINTSTSRIVEDHAGNGPQGPIQIEGQHSAAIQSIIAASTMDASRCGTLSLGRHRNDTVGGTPTIVQDGDSIGAICFAGGDGTDMRTKAAHILCEVDGTPGSNDMPGRLSFHTTADGASDPTERLRIDSAGRVMLGTTTEGYVSADDLTVATSGSTGITIRSGTGSLGTIAYSDGTSGDAEYRGFLQYDHNLDLLKIGVGGNERFRINSLGTFDFTNGALIEEVQVTSGKLSDNTNVNLDNGMVYLFTTAETTTSTPNIRINSTNTLDAAMGNGKVISLTIMTTAAAAGYFTTVTIDGNANGQNSYTLNVDWLGGSAPSAGGSSGIDVYNLTIIKQSSKNFNILISQNNYA